MLTSLFSVLSALLFALSLPVTAAPTRPTKLLAFAPSIITPNNQSVWVVGSSNNNVSWRTDNVPPQAQNYTLVVLLGQFANNSENLNTSKSSTFGPRVQALTAGSANPLASGVPIMAGSVSVTIPSGTPPGNNYTVVGKYPALPTSFVLIHSKVIGDSGDTSQPFSIVAAPDASGASY